MFLQNSVPKKPIEWWYSPPLPSTMWSPHRLYPFHDVLLDEVIEMHTRVEGRLFHPTFRGSLGLSITHYPVVDTDSPFPGLNTDRSNQCTHYRCEDTPKGQHRIRNIQIIKESKTLRSEYNEFLCAKLYEGVYLFLYYIIYLPIKAAIHHRVDHIHSI